jgi:hypothetical protein
MIDFQTWLHSIQKDSLTTSLRFTSTAYPSYTLNRLISHLKNSFSGSFGPSLSIADSSNIMNVLSSSFLGMSNIYWLSSLDNAPTEIQTFIKKYNGPHYVWYYASLNNDSSYTAGIPTIDVPETITANQYQQLYRLFYKGTCESSFLNTLFSHREKIDIEEACLLMHYHSLLGKNAQHFFTSWYERIFSHETSLFQLSQDLLQKNSTQFFHRWKNCYEEYPPEFWIAWLSDQLWQACIYCNTPLKEKSTISKKLRLPFSFIQRDWKQHSTDELMEAYHQLVLIDHGLKNGARPENLDIFCARFMKSGFQKGRK